jgi:uncharacterized protein YecT (DUF1311 family)
MRLPLPAIVAGLLSVALHASPGEAQQKQSYPCRAAETQRALNQCADSAFKKADARMKVAYAKLSGALADTSRRQALSAAQQAWTSYRDKYCRFIASAYEGGSMYPMQLGFCLAGVTEEREKQLGADLTNERL